MIPRIIVVMDKNISHYTIEFLQRLAYDDSLTLVREDTLASIATSLNDLRKLMPQDHDEDCCNPTAVRRGIEEFAEWLDLLVRQVLQIYVGNPRRPFTIFQPCWSSRRWKSLT